MLVNLYSDKRSGATVARRRGLEHALMDCRPGDVLVVWKLDRLSRSPKDLVMLSERLAAEGIELRSLHEQIDTTSPMGKFFFHLMAALAEFERGLIGFRTKKGMEAARARGAFALRGHGTDYLPDSREQQAMGGRAHVRQSHHRATGLGERLVPALFLAVRGGQWR